jgi:hypothetical protein
MNKNILLNPVRAQGSIIAGLRKYISGTTREESFCTVFKQELNRLWPLDEHERRNVPLQHCEGEWLDGQFSDPDCVPSSGNRRSVVSSLTVPSSASA